MCNDAWGIMDKKSDYQIFKYYVSIFPVILYIYIYTNKDVYSEIN